MSTAALLTWTIVIGVISTPILAFLLLDAFLVRPVYVRMCLVDPYTRTSVGGRHRPEAVGGGA